MSAGRNLSGSDADRQRIDRLDRDLAAGELAVPDLLVQLADPSWTVRRAVVGALAALGDSALPELVQHLCRARGNETVIAATVESLVASTGQVEAALLPLLAGAEVAVLADVAQILGRRQRPTAVPPLLALSEHASDNVAVAAIEALGRVGTRAAVEALLGALGSGNFFRVFPAIDVLGRSGDPRVVRPLAALLDNRTYALEAARALGRVGEKTAVAPLARWLAGGSHADVRVAARALAQLEEEYAQRYGVVAPLEQHLRDSVDAATATRRLGQALPGADTTEQVAICTLLGALGDPGALPLLMDRLSAPGPVGASANRALGRLSLKGDEQLAGALAATQGPARRAVLAAIKHPGAAEMVIGCLGDADPEVRAEACDTLARLGVQRAVTALFRLLADTNPLVVQSAIAAIQSLGSPETQRLALEAARSSEPAVRRWAVRVLAYFGNDDALEVLLEAANDADLRVQESAIAGLPLLDHPRARDALLAASRNGSAKVRAAAIRAFGHGVGDARVQAAILRSLEDSDPWVRYYACQAAGRLRVEAALDTLVARLADEAGQVRVSAVESLSHFDHPVAHRALATAVRSPELDIRQAAIVGAGITRLSAALPAVFSAASAQDTATRLLAVSSLAGFDDPEVNLVLKRAAGDPEESIRNAAIAALAGRPGAAATPILIGLARLPGHERQIAAALATPVAGRIDGLAQALSGADDDLAPLVTAALARINQPAATAVLTGALQLENVAARKAAVATLGGLGTHEALAAVRAASSHDPDPQVRGVCAAVLGLG